MRNALCDYEPCAAMCDLNVQTLYLQAYDQVPTAAAHGTSFLLGSVGSVAHLPQLWDSSVPHFVDIYMRSVDTSPLGHMTSGQKVHWV